MSPEEVNKKDFSDALENSCWPYFFSCSAKRCTAVSRNCRVFGEHSSKSSSIFDFTGSGAFRSVFPSPVTRYYTVTLRAFAKRTATSAGGMEPCVPRYIAKARNFISAR